MQISYSKIKTWRQCHQAYNYKYVQKLRRRIKKASLAVGSVVHEAIELHLRGQDPMEAIEAYRKEYNKLFEEEKVELEGTVELAEGMVAGYIKRYGKEPYEVLSVEEELNVEISDGILMEAKIDAVLKDKSKKIFIEEHKTCKSLWSETRRMTDVQAVIYANLYERAHGKKVSGIIWDYLRKKVPTVPEILKKGGLSKAKNIDTTYDVYLKAIKDNGLDQSDYVDMLDDLKQRTDTFYLRVKSPFNSAQSETIMKDIVTSAIEIKHLGLIATDRNLTKDCDWCDYFNLCVSELRGLDSSYIRSKEFIISEGRNKHDNRQEESD